MAYLPGEHFFRKTNIEEKIEIDSYLPEKIIRTGNPREMRAVRLRKRYGLIYEAEERRKGKHAKSVCSKCGKSSAYEAAVPDIKELSTPRLYIKTIVRYWKCGQCNYRFSTESPENILSNKGEYSEGSFVRWCKKCGISSYFEEFKKPDVYYIGEYKEITRYLQCRKCGGSRELLIEKFEPADTSV